MRRFSIKGKIILLVVSIVLLVAAVLLAVVLIQKAPLQRGISAELVELAKNETSKIAKDVYLMCQMTDEQVKLQVDHGLATAGRLAQELGGLHASQGDGQVEWEAVNQFSKDTQAIRLPQMLIGNQWLGQASSLDQSVPLIDEVVRLAGGTVTVFQRMNEQGDMLRVATTVVNKDGNRAIGTYIPAINPDGKPNPVLAEVLAGKVYKGRAFVVDSWYITAYEPIRNASGTIIGVLYYGVKQENIDSLRQGIMDIVVGKTGYVFVLAGSGDEQGTYIVSAKGARDGENIWEAEDASGVKFIQELVTKAAVTTGGSVDYQEYDWENPEKGGVETKVSAVTYFEPWDWVIGAGTYYSDYDAALGKVNGSLNGMIRNVVLWTVLALIIVVLLANLLAGKISNPIIAASKLAGQVAEGDLRSHLSVSTNDEVGDLVASLNAMNDKLRSIVNSLGEAAGNMAAGSQELAAATDETGRAVTLVSGRITEVVSSSRSTEQTMQQSSESLKQTAQAVQGVTHDIEEMASYTAQAAQRGETGKQAADQAATTIQQATESVKKTAGLVESLGSKTQQIAEFITIITGIADQTNLLALNAAIEAARAGEAGRGFAVVAEEVRKLAEESNQAAGNITDLVKGIETEMSTALDAMRQSHQEVDTGAQAVVSASETLAEIVEQVNLLSDKVQSISAAAEQISASTMEVVTSISSVADMARDNVGATEDVSAATEQQSAQAEEISANAMNMAKLASDLQELVAQFKI